MFENLYLCMKYMQLNLPMLIWRTMVTWPQHHSKISCNCYNINLARVLRNYTWLWAFVVRELSIKPVLISTENLAFAQVVL